jgi:hypothetical protein
MCYIEFYEFSKNLEKKISTIQGAAAVKTKPVVTSFERFTLVMAKPVD